MPIGHAALHDVPEGLVFPDQLLLLPDGPGLGHHEHQLDLSPEPVRVDSPPPVIPAS